MISQFSLGDAKIWGDIVSSFPLRDVYHLPAYVEPLKEHGDGEPFLQQFIHGDIMGISVVMKRDIEKVACFKGVINSNELFDLSTPYGYGGLVFNISPPEQVLKDLFNEYGQFCIDSGIVSEFVRFHPLLKNHESLKDFYSVEEIGKTIYIDTSSSETIWEQLSGKNRNMIRKAQKSGITIEICNDEEHYRKFMDLYNQTMKEHEASQYYYFSERYYWHMLNSLGGHTNLFCAKLDGNIIAAAIVLFENDRMHYHLSAMDRTCSHLAPMNMLLHEAANWGASQHIKTFHLGGGVGGKEDSLYQFKKSFNKLGESSFYIGKKVYNASAYERLTDIRTVHSEINSNYFPKYRG